MRPWDFWRHRMADGCLLAWRASVASQKQDSSGSSAFVAPFKEEEQLETSELWENVTSDVIYSMLEIWFRPFGGGRTTPLWRHKVWTNLGRLSANGLTWAYHPKARVDGRRVSRYISVRGNAFICCSTAPWDFMSCLRPCVGHPLLS